LNTPIVFIVFNRPHLTKLTFQAIRAQVPKTLFLVADGPRVERKGENNLCEEVRSILEEIDWPCTIYRNYSDENIGCKQRVISGLDWVFSIVDRAIIIEDDCLPCKDFFNYCENLLEHYMYDNRVMQITGDNFLFNWQRGMGSYYFSKYCRIWGWATWKRAWKLNDPDLSFWPEWENTKYWKRLFPDKVERKYWAELLNKIKSNEIDTWDYGWFASVWYHGGLTATPNVNLVSNIGVGPDGTHTISEEYQSGIPTNQMDTIIHPTKVRQDKISDKWVFYYTIIDVHKPYLRIKRRIIKKTETIIRNLFRL
jgi:hypothetical protein